MNHPTILPGWAPFLLQRPKKSPRRRCTNAIIIVRSALNFHENRLHGSPVCGTRNDRSNRNQAIGGSGDEILKGGVLCVFGKLHKRATQSSATLIRRKGKADLQADVAVIGIFHKIIHTKAYDLFGGQGRMWLRQKVGIFLHLHHPFGESLWKLCP